MTHQAVTDTSGNIAPHALANLRVLIVDDSATVRRGANNVLARLGCQVFQAADGFEALSRVVEHQPDVVLIDIMMPRLNGYSTCHLLKSHPTYREIPVILLSGNDSVFDQARGFLSGADDYLIKPFTHESLSSSLGACSFSSSKSSSGVNHGH